MTAKIAVLEGDYIGPEIMSSGLAVLAAVSAKYSFDYQLFNYPFGGQAIDKTGQPLPEETLQGAKEADAVLLSAIGGP
ncbi:3-isopropylmalate dehydrogenase, partial [Oenococcus alcoholitolerans]